MTYRDKQKYMPRSR